MLNVFFAEFHFMLNVVMLSVIMLSVVMLSVVSTKMYCRVEHSSLLRNIVSWLGKVL